VSGNNIYAGTDGGLIFLSTDYGSNWKVLDTLVGKAYGLPVSPPPEITSIVASDGNLFAGIGAGHFGVYLSTNNGRSWVEIDSDLLRLPSLGYPISCLGVVNKTLFAGSLNGIFRSTNNGKNWTNSLEMSFVFQFAVIGTSIYAASYNGVVVSSDEGLTWKVENAGLPIQPIRSIIHIAGIGTSLIAWTNEGIYRFINGGANWDYVGSGLVSSDINTLNARGNVLFAAGTGLFISSNEGANWTRTSRGSEIDSLNCLSIAFMGSEVFVGTYGYGIWRYPL
jgi:photosystem II stability/assembly factor-like uncharacterized protein